MVDKNSKPNITEISYEPFPIFNGGNNLAQNLKYGWVSTLIEDKGHIYGLKSGN